MKLPPIFIVKVWTIVILVILCIYLVCEAKAAGRTHQSKFKPTIWVSAAPMNNRQLTKRLRALERTVGKLRTRVISLERRLPPVERETRFTRRQRELARKIRKMKAKGGER